MKTFSGMKAEVRRVLDGTPFEKAWIAMGPEIPKNPGAGVMLTRYGGPGLDTGEGILDLRSWQVRSVGIQQNPDSAEDLADRIDVHFCSWYSRTVDGVRVPSIQRVGGAPAALMLDDAERTHFVCNYIVAVKLALTN